MANAAAAADSSPSCMDTVRHTISEFRERTPLITLSTSMFAVIGGIVGGWLVLAPLLALIPEFVLRSNGLQAYRIVTAPLVDTGLFNGLMAAIMIYQSASMIEFKKGSLFTLHAIISISIGATTLWMLTTVVLERIMHGIEMIPMLGLWPAVFGLLAVESILIEDQPPTRRLLCFPIDISARMYPLVLLVIFELLLLFSPGPIMGLAIGYLYAFIHYVRLSPETISAWDESQRLSFLNQKDTYVSLASAGNASVFNPFSAAFSGQSGRNGNGSQARNNAWNQPQQSGYVPPSHTRAQQPSVFQTTRGYQLGSPSPTHSTDRSSPTGQEQSRTPPQSAHSTFVDRSEYFSISQQEHDASPNPPLPAALLVPLPASPKSSSSSAV